MSHDTQALLIALSCPALAIAIYGWIKWRIANDDSNES